MEIELRTDGVDCSTTRLFVDGDEILYIKRIRIYLNGIHKATMDADRGVAGSVPFVPYATIEIDRFDRQNTAAERFDIVTERFERVNIVPLKAI
ncbi:MAG: hypothetical protein PHD64_10165 [Mesotoga sp.]|jgi:hypothetical protein|nr:hypothetical protein [Mesotoga sp.]